MSDKYEKCPLKEAGMSLETFRELPAMIIGADGKCICTVGDRCIDVDKRDDMRCTLQQLRALNSQASSRRARQSGDDW